MREVDFLTESTGRVELFEARWTEIPSPSDAVNLQFVRGVMGDDLVADRGIVGRTPNSFPLAEPFRALPATELS